MVGLLEPAVLYAMLWYFMLVCAVECSVTLCCFMLSYASNVANQANRPSMREICFHLFLVVMWRLLPHFYPNLSPLVPAFYSKQREGHCRRLLRLAFQSIREKRRHSVRTRYFVACCGFWAVSMLLSTQPFWKLFSFRLINITIGLWPIEYGVVKPIGSLWRYNNNNARSISQTWRHRFCETTRKIKAS